MENSKPTLKQLIQEYNTLFRDNPRRWDELKKDDYAWEMINLYWQATRGRERQPAAMLDIGCGSGHTIACFLSRWPLTRYYGLDLSEEAIRFAHSQVPNAQFLVGAWGKFEFRIKFDIIVVLGVLEHFKDPIRALEDIKLLLSPGGFAYIEVPNCISYSGPGKVEGFRRLGGGNRQWEWHLFRQSWEEMIRKSGLTINLSLKGPRKEWEFIWILTNKPRIIPIQYRGRMRIFEQRARLREMGLILKTRLAGLKPHIVRDALSGRIKF